MTYTERKDIDGGETQGGDLAERFRASFSRRGFSNVERYSATKTALVAETGLSKITQINANYKPAFGAARCGNCAHYRKDGKSCELVEGTIEPNDTCDFFAPERPDLTEAANEGYAKELEKYGQPSDHVSPEKAKEILRDGEVHGHPLTKAQEGMFGAAAGRGND